MAFLTIRYKLKNYKKLKEQAFSVNQVWNFCCETQKTAQRRQRLWPSNFTLNNLLTSCGQELAIASDVFQCAAARFVSARSAFKRCPKFRASRGSKRSLGWVPFMSGRGIKVSVIGVTFMKVFYPCWVDRPLPGPVKCGSFNEDAKGNWYVNLVCEVPEALAKVEGEEIGIDLGLKDLATLSTGEKLENPRHYRREEQKIAVAQRAGRKKLARALHAKVRNRRKHDLHQIDSKQARSTGKDDCSW